MFFFSAQSKSIKKLIKTGWLSCVQVIKV